jgi:hypothetical protein
MKLNSELMHYVRTPVPVTSPAPDLSPLGAIESHRASGGG